tara:strand:- start:85 stop:633 length:549 start_codon:yes stop_codon:yes gene_type:complete
MKDYLKYDDTQIFKYDNLILAFVYTVGHILIAMTCNRIITGASFDVAAADAFIEPIINGFWFYFLLVFLKKTIIQKIEANNFKLLNSSRVGIYLAVIYTVGHIFIAMACNRLLTGAPLNLAAVDALVEPMVNGFWFYLLFEVFNKYKKVVHESNSGKSSKNPSPSMTRTSKLAPINNKKDLD